MRNSTQKYNSGNYALITSIIFFLVGIMFSILPFRLINIVVKQQNEPVTLYGWFILISIECGGIFSMMQAFFLWFVDPLGGKYSLNDKGISLYTFVCQHQYLWEDLIDVGITRWQADAGIGTRDYIYFVYFSKQPISYENRKWIVKFRSFRKPKKPNMPLYLKDYAVIQYSRKKFPALLESVPDWMREKLVEEEKRVVLNRYEKLLNR